MAKRNNFTKTNIIAMINFLGYGFKYIDEDRILIETKGDKHTSLEVNKKNDCVLLNGKDIYKSNQDKELFDVFPSDKNKERYGEDFNPFCNIYYLFKYIENLTKEEDKNE